jgi:hypothetical protein
MKELSVIQKSYDCIKWYVPIIERLPKIHRFTLGDRIINQLYKGLPEIKLSQFMDSTRLLLPWEFDIFLVGSP